MHKKDYSLNYQAKKRAERYNRISQDRIDKAFDWITLGAICIMVILGIVWIAETLTKIMGG